MNNSIANNIIKLRKEKRLTQQNLAKQLNISTAAVCKWETGASIPDINTICQIADFFGVSVDYILGREVLQKKCVVFCTQADHKEEIGRCIQDEDIFLQAYTRSIVELEQYLENTLEYVPTVIYFSTGEHAERYSKRLDELSKAYGFKLLSINTLKTDEYKVLLGISLKSFKW